MLEDTLRPCRRWQKGVCGRSRPITDNQSRIKDINTHCLAEFRKHWECLDDRNHQLWQCRPAEWKLNKCVFDNLVRLACEPGSLHV